MNRSVLQGLRWMLRRPLVALTSAVCLSIGIAACATAWTLIDAAILRPYGLEGSHRLVLAWEADAARNQPLIEVSHLNFLDWQREARTVEAMAALGSQHWPALARFGSDMVPLTTRGVTATFFAVLGVQPHLGRGFTADDGRPDVPAPIVLSHRLWQARFAGRPDVVGQTLFVNGADYAIVGVMPPGFAYPDDPDAWTSVERVLGQAFQNTPIDQQRRVGLLEVLARRRPSASNDDVRAELTGIVQRLQREHASSTASVTTIATVTPLTDVIVGRLGQRLWIALGMSIAVFLLACANVAAARGAFLRERAGELTARLLLGATRRHLARELVSESLPLAAVGTVAGSVLLLALLELLSGSTSIQNSGLVLRDHLGLTGLLILGLGALSWGLVAVGPAMLASRNASRSTFHSATRVVARSSRIGAPLLFGQAMLAIAVVALSAAAVQTFERLSRIDIGFSTQGVTLLDFSLPNWKYGSVAERRTTVERLQERLRELPSVTRVAAVSVRPFRFGEIVDGLPVRRTGDAVVQPDDATGASRVAVTPDYFDALGQRILHGRPFTALDHQKSEPVAIISRTLAGALFGDRPAVGERIDTFSLSEKWRSRLIVGVAGDAQYRGLERPSMEVYVPLAQVGSAGSLVIASAAPLTESAVRQQLRLVESDVAVEGFQTAGELRASVLSPARLLTTVVSLLGGAGLLLLTLGIFAAAAAALRAAWAEIAVRQAIGARPFQAAAVPLRLLTRALTLGVLAGLTLSPAVLSAAATLGLSAPGAFMLPLAAALVLVPAAAAAAMVPSLLRAAKSTPAELLRDA